MSNNNYPLDEKALEEQYADLLLKIALKEYLKEQALQMKQQEAEAAPAPQPTQEKRWPSGRWAGRRPKRPYCTA